MSGLLNGTPFGSAVGKLWSPTGELLDLQYAAINAASSGNNTLVAAVAGKSIYVVAMEFITAGAVTVEIQSGAGGTVLSKAQSFPANGGKVLPFNPGGWFKTASATLLNMSLGGAVQVSGSLVYVVF